MQATLSNRVIATIVAAALLSPVSAMAQDRAMTELAQRVLAASQGPSIQRGAEYCGTIGIDGSGRLLASQPMRGGRDSCEPRDHPDVAEVRASFHTHGSFDPEADSELPSSDDVLGDMQEGLDGYLATPGGRFWFIDGRTGVARQLCGPGCLPSDPRFRPGVFGRIANRYTLRELQRRERELN